EGSPIGVGVSGVGGRCVDGVGGRVGGIEAQQGQAVVGARVGQQAFPHLGGELARDGHRSVAQIRGEQVQAVGVLGGGHRSSGGTGRQSGSGSHHGDTGTIEGSGGDVGRGGRGVVDRRSRLGGIGHLAGLVDEDVVVV